MPGSPVIARKASEKYSGNITKRGKVAKKEKEDKMPVSGVVLVVLLFVVVGSLFMQFLQTLNNKHEFED
ncbi:hypothetical protein DIPPA_11437 [Diplonema papillatum]|nr:hypothetical protein DIPPA_11437 [Diplonema papillatum]